MKFRKKVKIEKGVLDLTPMVNVFFLLLIFFLFTSNFIFQPGMKVSLPKAVTSEVVQSENAVIIVTADDKVYLDDRQINEEELVSKLSLLAKEKMGLLIKADKGASYGRIIKIWDLCRQEGLSQVNTATTR